MSEWAAKRFWKAASVVELDGGFAVELDGRGVKTPAKRPLHLPTRAMAQAVEKLRGGIHWPNRMGGGGANPNFENIKNTYHINDL